MNKLEELENERNEYFSDHNLMREERKRAQERKEEHRGKDDSSMVACLEDFIIGNVIGKGAYAVVRIGLHKPSDK